VSWTNTLAYFGGAFLDNKKVLYEQAAQTPTRIPTSTKTRKKTVF
jgi:hypothetical protein